MFSTPTTLSVTRYASNRKNSKEVETIALPLDKIAAYIANYISEAGIKFSIDADGFSFDVVLRYNPYVTHPYSFEFMDDNHMFAHCAYFSHEFDFVDNVPFMFTAVYLLSELQEKLAKRRGIV